MGKIKFQVFGSHDSKDIDVIVFVDSLPNIQMCKELCEKYSNDIKKKYSIRNQNIVNKKVDVNIGVLNNGLLVDVYKGSIDEVNNSLYYTYNYHLPIQLFPQQIKYPVERDLNVKLLRSTRIILSLLSRTQYRESVKLALKKDFREQVNVIKSIDFSTLIDFGTKNGSKADIYKRIVFQIGQTLALVNGFDLYSKSSISGMYPTISRLMNRTEHITKTDYYNLESFKRNYTNILSKYFEEIGCENEKTYKLEKNVV